MSLSVPAEILELFNHTLTAEDRHSLHNRERLTQSTQMYLFKKQKSFVTVCSISQVYIKFKTFFLKRRASGIMYFRILRLQKT